MTEILTFSPDEILPQRAPVLAHQGISAGRPVSAAVEETWCAARDRFGPCAEPVGVFREIEHDEFARVYAGAGRNELRTPVDDVAPRAERLALFAVTLGPRISREITARFEAHDLALGCMLDSVASVAADVLAARLGERYLEGMQESGEIERGAAALGYSPGYCGWDISGQAALFAFLRPQRIGITLRESYLMDPLKSVSGVVVVGPPEIHVFEMDYAFCVECRTRSCRARIKEVEER